MISISRSMTTKIPSIPLPIMERDVKNVDKISEFMMMLLSL
jgi:hypothetical protein